MIDDRVASHVRLITHREYKAVCIDLADDLFLRNFYHNLSPRGPSLFLSPLFLILSFPSLSLLSLSRISLSLSLQFISQFISLVDFYSPGELLLLNSDPNNVKRVIDYAPLFEGDG